MCDLEIVVANDGNALSIPSDWLPDNAPEEALAFRRWYVVVAGLSVQPHSIGFREPVLSACSIPVSFLNRDRPSGRLRRQLLLSGEPFGSRGSDYALLSLTTLVHLSRVRHPCRSTPSRRGDVFPAAHRRRHRRGGRVDQNIFIPAD
jgi:hypothetical protein